LKIQGVLRHEKRLKGTKEPRWKKSKPEAKAAKTGLSSFPDLSNLVINSSLLSWILSFHRCMLRDPSVCRHHGCVPSAAITVCPFRRSYLASTCLVPRSFIEPKGSNYMELEFFSRKCRKTALHCIKKIKQGVKSPITADTT
jgi:hypothetical protein